MSERDGGGGSARQKKEPKGLALLYPVSPSPRAPAFQAVRSCRGMEGHDAAARMWERSMGTLSFKKLKFARNLIDTPP